MFFLDLIKIGNLKWFILSGGFCFVAGYMAGKTTTKEKVVAKTEYSGKSSTTASTSTEAAAIEQAQKHTADKLISNSKSNLTTAGTTDKKTKTRRNIVTQTRTYKKDGTVTETMRTDTSTIDDSAISFERLAASSSSATDKTTSGSTTTTTSSISSSESHLTQDASSSSSSSSVSSRDSVIAVGLGFSYRGDLAQFLPIQSNESNGNNNALARLGFSSELKIYSLGVQAQVFGDGSLVGTIKIWL
jgi:hypothetical protein